MANLFENFNRLVERFLELGSYGGYPDYESPEVESKKEEIHMETTNQILTPTPETQISVATKQKKIAPFELRRSTDLVSGSKILSSFPIPLRQPRKEKDRDFERQVNEVTYRITCSNKYGYPFGQDALIILIIEDIARKTKNRKVELDSIYTFLKHLGLGDGKQNYKRFLEATQRLFYSKFIVFRSGNDGMAMNLEVFEAIHIKGVTPNWEEARGNFMAFTESHFQRIINEEVPYDLEVFRRLTHSAGALRLYRFVAPRAYNAATSREGIVRINAADFLNQIGCESYSNKRKRKQMLKRWKVECDEALLTVGVGHLPFDINDDDVVSIFPKFLLPGVTKVMESDARTKPKRLLP